MGERRKYTKTEYFEFLFDLGFGGANKYYDLAKELHKIDYIWYNRMDENRMYDGIEIRKYYLSDDLGYMPDDIDEYDEYIFPETPSILEVWVGFANRLCRDILDWRVDKLIKMWVKELGLEKCLSHFPTFKETIDDWMNGEIYIFPIKSGDLGQNNDLWTQAAIWMQDLG